MLPRPRFPAEALHLGHSRGSEVTAWVAIGIRHIGCSAGPHVHSRADPPHLLARPVAVRLARFRHRECAAPDPDLLSPQGASDASLTVSAQSADAWSMHRKPSVDAAVSDALSPLVDAAVPLAPDAIDKSLFGLHMKHADTTTPWPTVPFGTWRLWDAQVGWSSLEPSRGQWSWTILNRDIALAEQHHTDVILTLALTPTWASARPTEPSGYRPGNAAEPANLADWQTYIQTVATRYKGRITHYEIWTEPNLAEFYTGTVPTMVSLAKIAYTTLKAIDPNIVVHCPPTTAGNTSFIDSYFTAGGAAYTDVVDYHFYTWPGPPERMLPTVDALRVIMKNHALDDKPLWSTEAGWLIYDANTVVTAASWNEVLPWATASAYVARAYALAAANGLARYYFYGWDDPSMGLTEANGITVKPPGIAYGQVYAWLVGSHMKGCPVDASGTYECTLAHDDGTTSFMVWNPRTTVNFSVPAGATSYRDLTGKTTPLNGARTLSIGGTPILLE